MRGFWLDEALTSEGLAMSPLPALSGEQRTDVCIVGGGYTGLWTAIWLKQRDPSIDVVIIDKDICGGGASGRNGGFCMTWMSKAETLVKLCGEADAIRLLRESETAVLRIGEFCAKHDIDCEFRQEGWVWTASNESQRRAWGGTTEALDRLGLRPFESLSPARLESLTGSSAFLEGVFEAGVATVQPARLARGLRRVCLDLGVHIFEQTRMRALARGGSPVVTTTAGRIVARKVVLGLNAWAHELPEFRRSVLPVQSDVIATEPIPDQLHKLGLDRCIAISDSRLLVSYYRPTVGGRLVWGYGGGPIPAWGRVAENFDGAATRESETRAMMTRFYPTLSRTKLSSSWRGPATRTASGLPFFGHLNGHPDIVYGHGYCGNGVGPSYLGGRILASLAMGEKDEWSQNGLTRGEIGPSLPREPIRYFGSLLIRAAAIRADNAFDRNRQPTALDRRLVALMPSGLTPTNGKKSR
ncbi:MAG: hypothetical protein QOK29_2829 [Rhodospirillaceae bacterium]|jgi:putative aminophosphonate oxidoreductase|nr:hypothetical protein [Rhodospirillaceae bacterium]